MKSLPVDGAANRELVMVLARYFDLKPYQIRLVKGHMIPMKVIEIE